MINKIFSSGDSNRIIFFTLIISLLTLNLQGQQPKVDSLRLKKNLQYLAGDSMMGRSPGTVQDSLAALFIAAQLKESGFKPLIGNSILIPFKFTLHREVAPGSLFRFSGENFKDGADYKIIPISPDFEVEGEVTSMEYNDLKKLSVNPSAIESSPMKKMFEGKLLFVKMPYDSIQFFTTPVALMGFKALLFNSPNSPTISDKSRSSGVPVPVIWVSENLSERLKTAPKAICTIAGEINVVQAVSYNIAAIKPGNDGKYILAGAHYDHLGMGGEGSSSMFRSGEGVHNGADDNASGVVSVLEAGRVLSGSGVAIAAFGAEERGLFGSQILADTLMALNKLPALMINLDMVGRMNEKRLQAGGAGTFKGADSLLRKVNEKFNFEMTVTNDGFGPSDHSSFYNKGVPVLYFTTGVHKEYHTPADDVELINFKGLTMVTEYLAEIISEIKKSNFKPEYIKSDAPATSARRSFKVTLGLIPDFTYEKGDGFRIGAVTDGRAAQKSGLKEGDIIVMMKSKMINNIYDYMSSLETLNKGDVVPVKVRRGEKEIEFKIEL
ncbi:MAG: M28 family peptidase [Bacteroidales bacterium]